MTNLEIFLTIPDPEEISDFPVVCFNFEIYIRQGQYIGTAL